MVRKTLFALLLAGLLTGCGAAEEDAAVGIWRLDPAATVSANHNQTVTVTMKIADEVERVAGAASADELRRNMAMEMPQVERELLAMAEADADAVGGMFMRIDPDRTLEMYEVGGGSTPADTGTWSRIADDMVSLEVNDSSTGELIQMVGNVVGDRIELQVLHVDPNDREDLYDYGLRVYRNLGVSEAFLRAIIDNGELDPYMVLVRQEQ